MKVLYLYAEIMGYTMATIRNLIERGHEVHIVHWDHKKLTPYQVTSWPNVYMYNRSTMSVRDIQGLVNKLSPEITVISGWEDKGYMKIARQLRLRGDIVVSGFDDQWLGKMRQNLAAILGQLGYFKRYYSHAWVSGVYQFEYARRLGFDKKHIIYDLYSADLSLFKKAYQDCLQDKQQNYPHRFLFVGRLEPVKGLDTLLKAWQSLGDSKLDWELHLVGNGSLKTELNATQGVFVKNFMQPECLMDEVAQAGCFVLPSRGEPWGVVVHEFAAAGMPLIVSDVVGAASTFLIPGMNGFSFEVNNSAALADKMLHIIKAKDEDLLQMSINSHKLSHKITAESSAANLLSVQHK
tara:strand:+ start:256 stop:1308 length:1053 start_codon:yes stop_codon:yes gene_type:complete